MFFSVGHSNHKPDVLADFLSERGITDLIDVRSKPYSRFNPGFNVERFHHTLAQRGIEFFWRGETLGGYSPRDETMALTLDRMVSYYARRPKRRPVFMCSESDACDCHRHHSIATYLAASSRATVVHIHPKKPDLLPEQVPFAANHRDPYPGWPIVRPFRVDGPGVPAFVSRRGYATADEATETAKKACPATADRVTITTVE